MKTLRFLFLLATLAVSAGHGQESPITGPPACRFLFIVESSKGMARIASGTAATVAGLVASGVSGLMRPGDSFALWHFNEEPFPFEFPNRAWQPDQAPTLAAEARAYLQKLRFNKPVRADLALREMFIAMRATDPLTVLLISNGESPMVGTPFDVEINKVYLRRAEELRRARVPFVTTLRCVNRQIEYAAVTAGREEIVLPDPVLKMATAAVAPNPSAGSPTKGSPVGVGGLSAPPTPITAPLGVIRERITNVFGTVFSPLSTSAVVAPTTAVALAPPADGAASAAPIGAPDTNAVAAAAAPVFPNVSRPVESPLTVLRISPARTNGESALSPPPQLPPLASANPGAAIAPPSLAPAVIAATGAMASGAAIFPRKSSPSFALETAAVRSAPAAVGGGNPPPGKAEAVANPILPPAISPAAGTSRPSAAPPTLSPRIPGTPLVPERIPEPPKRIAGATNSGGKTLGTVPPLINPDAPTRPVHFLFAGLVLLAVAGWFIVLIMRGNRRQSRSSISRAMDE